MSCSFSEVVLLDLSLRVAFIVGFSQQPWERGNPICFSILCLHELGDCAVVDNKANIARHKVWIVSVDLYCSL